MKVEDILNQPVTIMDTINTHPQKTGAWMKDVPLIQILMATNWNDKIEETRRLNNPETNKEYKAYKAHNLPAWTVSGTFKHFGISINNIIKPNNLIALDIDVKDGENDNIDIDRLRLTLFSKPYVVAALKSVGGKGIYVLILVEDYTHTSGYAMYLKELYKQQYGVDIDTNAIDLARRRFVSSEENICKWIKPNQMDIKPWKLYCSDEEVQRLKSKQPDNPFDEVTSLHTKERQINLFPDNDEQKERTHKAMWMLLNKGFNAQSRGYWYHIGCDLAAFPDGRQMFEKLCSNWGSQDKKSIDATWKGCEKNPNPINDEMHKRWQGMAKNRLGATWWMTKED